jgi:hypothetical protein
MYVCIKIEFLNFLNFEILHTSEFGFLFVIVRVVFFVLDDGGLDFGDCSRTVLAFFALGNGMNDVSSSWKMEDLL